MHANNGDSHISTFDDEGILLSDLERDEEDISSNALVTFANRLSRRFGVKVVTRSVPEEEDDGCEFDLRMTDVPEDVLAANTEPDLLEVRFATLGKTLWQRIPHKRVLTRLLLLVLLALLVSISAFGHTLLNFFPLSSVLPQPTQTTSFAGGETSNNLIHTTEPNVISLRPNNEVTVAARGVPHYCPASVMLGQGKQIGNFPVWMSGIDSTNATVHLPTLTLKTIKGWKGWVVPLHVLAKYGYTINIVLTTFNIYGSSTPLFQNPGSTLATPHLFINTMHPVSFVGTARKIGNWDISLYLPSAGCYAISAAWGRGHWQINFEAGQ